MRAAGEGTGHRVPTAVRLQGFEAVTQASVKRRRKLPGEPLRAKAAHLTLAGCFIGSGLFLMWCSWDHINCVAGESTATGPCGVGIHGSAAVFGVSVILLLAGAIALYRGLRRPVDPQGSGGWRIGQAFAVMGCMAIVALLIPRQSCPEGTHLSPVFRFCVSATRSFDAPSTGLAWRWAAFGLGIVLGVVLLRWRSMPWQLATALVVVVFAVTSVYTATRSTGLPWERLQYTVEMVPTDLPGWLPSGSGQVFDPRGTR